MVSESFREKLESMYDPERVEAILTQIDRADATVGAETVAAQLPGVEPRLEYYLLIIDRSPEVWPHMLEIGELLIGRDESCPINLSDPKVSRFHCLLTVHAPGNGSRLTLRDLRSLNGTFLNGSPLDPDVRTPVHEQDAIRLGDCTLIVTRLPLSQGEE